jgi:hypothetical protein
MTITVTGIATTVIQAIPETSFEAFLADQAVILRLEVQPTVLRIVQPTAAVQTHPVEVQLLLPESSS